MSSALDHFLDVDAPDLDFILWLRFDLKLKVWNSVLEEDLSGRLS